jgi:hypothetical protein
MYTTNTTQKRCEAHIAINRSRLKSYDKNHYYLKDKTNFEIEIFNPHTVSVLAKIKMNGEYISSAGLVVKPGQRIFLSRYLDTNNSFLFETYEIEKTRESLEAIAKNGKIEVEFHLEQKITVSSGNTTWITAPSIYYTNNIGGGFNQQYFSSNPVLGDKTSIVRDTLFSSSVNMESLDDTKVNLSADIQETGRIERGESTDQEMESTFGSYNYWPSETVSIQLFPESIKPVEVSEIRTYCTECGTRMKKATWKFCPNCGTKVE